MSNRSLSQKARRVESLFESGNSNSLQVFALQEMTSAIESRGFSPSSYELFAVRKNDQAGQEVLGPKNLHVGNYSEEALYGAASSPLPHFRSAIRTLAARAARAARAASVAGLEPDEVEYSYQVTLFWADLGKLKDFLGVSTSVSELVTELLTARFQFIGKDTPASAMKALAQALAISAGAKRLDSAVVERVVDALEAGGIDSLAPDALRHTHA